MQGNNQKIVTMTLHQIKVKILCLLGLAIDIHSKGKFQGLVRKAYLAMSEQCPEFSEALKATKNKRLFHSIGNPNPKDTILTEKELCDILTELRYDIQLASIFDNLNAKKQ